MNPEVFKQAQSREWMEGWEYAGEATIFESQKKLHEFRSIDPAVRPQLLSLNDILFGTDFCEKFIGDFIMGDCICGLSCIYNQTIGETHKMKMLSMSEPERIAFLEKHLEVEQNTTSKGCTMDDCHCEIGESKKVKEEAMDGHTFMNSKIKRLLNISKEQESEEEIEKIACHMWHSSGGKEKEVFSKEEEKINELVQQVNTNTKAFAAHVKDCKLNRN